MLHRDMLDYAVVGAIVSHVFAPRKKESRFNIGTPGILIIEIP